MADYFDIINEYFLVRLPIPDIMGGITAPFENIGEMTNKGFELSITYNNGIRDQDRLGYMINANLTNVTNQVNKFRGGETQVFALRKGCFNAHFLTQQESGDPTIATHDPSLLYNLDIDPSGKCDIAEDHPEIIAEIIKLLEEHLSRLFRLKINWRSKSVFCLIFALWILICFPE